MNSFDTMLVMGLMGFIARVLTIACGFACIYLGYKLYRDGVLTGGSDATFNSPLGGFRIGKGAPGLAFAAFGAVVVAFGIFDKQIYSARNRDGTFEVHHDAPPDGPFEVGPGPAGPRSPDEEVHAEAARAAPSTLDEDAYAAPAGPRSLAEEVHAEPAPP
jgi:hypothetical protein